MGCAGCALLAIGFFVLYLFLQPLAQLQTLEGIPTNNLGVGLATYAYLVLPFIDIAIIWKKGIEPGGGFGIRESLRFYGRIAGIMAILLVANFIVVQLLLLVP